MKLTESQLRDMISKTITESLNELGNEFGLDYNLGNMAPRESWVCVDTIYGEGVRVWVTTHKEEAEEANNSSEGWSEGPFEDETAAFERCSELLADNPGWKFEKTFAYDYFVDPADAEDYEYNPNDEELNESYIKKVVSQSIKKILK